MSNTPYIRTIITQAAIENIPSILRNSLLEDRLFRGKCEITSDAVLSIGESGLSIRQSSFYEAIRKKHSGTDETTVVDTENRKWNLYYETEHEGPPVLVISNDEQRLSIPHFPRISADFAKRIQSLDKSACDVNLPAEARNDWHSLLSERPLENDEVDEYLSDFRDTPVQLTRAIRNEIATGRSSISSLVPSSRRYFERLVGKYDGSASISEYAAGAGRQFINGLLAWRQYDGFLFSLFLSSHATLTVEIDITGLGSEDLARAFNYLVEHGDTISQLGAVEVGLRVLPDRPEIEPSITRLIEAIRDDDIDSSARGLKLLSSLYILVDGEVSRTRLMPDTPPFYRRLASLAQAALIHRQLIDSGVDDRFCEWAFENRGGHFYWQSLADMRLEPRWHPDLSVASQMKADFFGRIMNAATNFANNIEGRELQNLIFGNKPNSLFSRSEFPYHYIPGPLEGTESHTIALPDDFFRAIEEQLNSDEIGPSSFIALVNSAMIFHVGTDQAELAANVLKLGNYHLSNIEDKNQLLAILNGLATVAATSRSIVLADELRILARRYRSDKQHRLSLEEAMRICLVASASRKELNEWREFTGEWLTELAFSNLKDDEGEAFHSHLNHILHAVPELWVTSSRADAALKAFLSR